MTTMTVTVRQLAETASQRLGTRKQRRLARRLDNPRKRQAMFDDLIDTMAKDETCCSLGLQPLFGSDAFTEDTLFQIDPEKLDELLAVIFKWLEVFLTSILPLFMSIAFFLLALFIPSTASAQQCYGPGCQAGLPLWVPADPDESLSTRTTATVKAESPIAVPAGIMHRIDAPVKRSAIVPRYTARPKALAGRRQKRVTRRRSRVARFGYVGLAWLRR